MKYLFSLLMMGVMAVSSPAFAQDPDPAPAFEKADPADDAAAVPADDAAAPADDAAVPPEDAATPDSVPADDAATPEGEGEKAAEGDEKAKAGAKVPETDAEAVQTATALLDALQGKEWPLAVGLLLTLLVYLANKFALKGMVGVKVLPFVAGGIGFAGATGVGLATGEPIVDALIAGGLAAVAAVGGWEAVSKLVSKSEDKPEAEKTDPGA